MSTWRRKPWGQRGLTLAELLVAVAVFALFVIMIDAVFLSVNRSAKKAELAAEVQQNARIAVERLTREIRESRTSEIAIGGSAGAMAVVFKSARLPADNSVFCLYVRNSTDPPTVYNTDCFTFPGGNLSAPPYGSNPASPLGTYTPIWQRSIGYYLAPVAGGYELRRVVAQLNQPGSSLPSPTSLSGGDVIAVFVESFDLSLAGGNFQTTLKVRGQEVVQGSTVPVQEILLPGTTLIRN